MQDPEDIVVNGNGTEPGHIIVTSIEGRNGQAKQVFLKIFISGIMTILSVTR
jgi:hypothetical protein